MAVLNTSKGDARVDRRYADQEDLAPVREALVESGIPFTLDQRPSEGG